MTPVISIVVPVYMAENHLHECVKSVLKQTFQDWELILIDDGSRDQSGKICDNYSQMDDRIIVIHKENGGVSSARNLGIEKAQGLWINFLDADDWLADDYLQKLYDASSITDFVISGFIMFFRDGKTEKWNSFDYIAYNKKDIGNIMVEMNSYRLLNSMDTKLFKSKIVKENKLSCISGLSVSEDMLFVYEYIKHCQSLTCINYSGYYYRRDISNSLSNKAFPLETYLYSRDMLYNLRKEFIDVFSITDPKYQELVLKGFFDSTVYCQRGLSHILSLSYYKELYMLIDNELLREYVSNYDVSCSPYDKFIVECIKRKSILPAIKRLIVLIIKKMCFIS